MIPYAERRIDERREQLGKLPVAGRAEMPRHRANRFQRAVVVGLRQRSRRPVAMKLRLL